MAILVLVVSRAEPSRLAYLRHVFGGDTVDVIMDRRVEERRQHWQGVAAERRQSDRRQRDVTKDLDAYGWALVRRWP